MPVVFHPRVDADDAAQLRPEVLEQHVLPAALAAQQVRADLEDDSGCCNLAG